MQETEPSPPSDKHSPPQEFLRIEGSRLFTHWLASQNGSLVFTTYQGGKIFFIGLKEGGKLSVFERTFDRCMGLAAQGGTLWMSARNQMWRFEEMLDPGKTHQGYDALYVPLSGHTTGDVDIHDIGILPDGQPVFVVTLFNCLATLDRNSHFAPIWKPPFISRLAAEDRCHLNGLAMEQGRPRFVTMVSRTDVAEGWREHRVGGGLVMDIMNNEVVCEGLSMPHSPRFYRDRLWLLNAGSGEFGFVDLATRKFQALAFCPGFLRGLSFIGDYAVVGLSKPRHNRTFNGLPLNDRLQAEGIEPRSGLQVIHLETGDSTHWLRIEGSMEELYDVITLPGVRTPMALGFRTPEIGHFIKIGDFRDIR